MNEWVCSIGGMMLTGGTLKHLDKRYVEATLSTTNSTQTSLRLKPSLYSEAVPAWAMVLPHNIQWKWKRKITAFSLYIWPPYIDTLQHTELHILNFIALPRLNPYLFLEVGRRQALICQPELWCWHKFFEYVAFTQISTSQLYSTTSTSTIIYAVLARLQVPGEQDFLTFFLDCSLQLLWLRLHVIMWLQTGNTYFTSTFIF